MRRMIACISACVLAFASVASAQTALRAAAQAMCDAVPARPGRFDYWESATHGKKARLLNKLGQDVGTYQLSPSDRATLVRLVETHL